MVTSTVVALAMIYERHEMGTRSTTGDCQQPYTYASAEGTVRTICQRVAGHEGLHARLSHYDHLGTSRIGVPCWAHFGGDHESHETVLQDTMHLIFEEARTALSTGELRPALELIVRRIEAVRS